MNITLIVQRGTLRLRKVPTVTLIEKLESA